MVREESNSSMATCFSRRRSTSSYESPSSKAPLLQKDVDSSSTTSKRKPGWKAMPYILGTESIERMATNGLTTNFMVYLVREYHMDQVFAANILNIWTCACCLLTIIGASVADMYLGRFLTIALAASASLLGMITITLTAFVPQLRPPPCIIENGQKKCVSSTKGQLGLLLFGLGWLSIGTGGIKPCCIAFGLDQFDSTTVEGRNSGSSYLNWYYTSITLIMLINQTLVVYIQDAVSWALGFGIPTLLMLCTLPMFLFGSKIYFNVKPQGSIFSDFAQVLVAAYKKRHLKLHDDDRVHGVFFNEASNGNVVLPNLPVSKEYSYLKKAALVVGNELNHDGSCANPWRLCSIQQVEEVIFVMKILPIWASGVICLLVYAQEGTFIVSQALKMDRHIGPNFQMPAGSIKMMSLTTTIITLPLYDRVLQPALRKITKNEDGISPLQRIGIGYLFSIMCMVVAGLMEQQRRALAGSHASPNGVAPMSVLWLFPQLMLLGLCEVFGIFGHTEFYNKEFPEKMRSIGNAFTFLCLAGGTYLSSVVASIVHNVTGKHGEPNWLDNDINAGRLDYFYFLIAGFGVLNFVYFWSCARGYTYNATSKALLTDLLV